jgi:hypothetical protein
MTARPMGKVSSRSEKYEGVTGNTNLVETGGRPAEKTAPHPNERGGSAL